jgi:predicted AAA+ superfamily ATPase
MFKRSIVKKLTERLNEERRFIQILTGPRQTGKTTALLQAIKTHKGRSHYISADNPPPNAREWLINEWNKARELAKNSNDGATIVIDEIQKIKGWSEIIKMLWDQDAHNSVNLKAFLSGSSALLLTRGMTESLMGRFEVLHITHWSYSECVKAFGYNLDDYLYFGGYPGAASLISDEDRWADYLGSSIVEPTISQDIMQLEEIRKPALLRALFSLGASFSAQELSYTKMLGQLQDAGNTVTLAHYLELLSRARILCGLEKYSPNILAMRKSSPRLMVYDTGLMSYSYRQNQKLLLADPEKRGHLVESAVGAYLLARADTDGFDVFWWNSKEGEVDFVLKKGQRLTAIEVKSGRVRKTGGSLAFKAKYPDALSMVVGGDVTLEEFLSGKVPLFL